MEALQIQYFAMQPREGMLWLIAAQHAQDKSAQPMYHTLHCVGAGTIPSAAWQGMKRLQQLFLINNKLHGPLPQATGMPPALQNLNLASNAFEGELH